MVKETGDRPPVKPKPIPVTYVDMSTKPKVVVTVADPYKLGDD